MAPWPVHTGTMKHVEGMLCGQAQGQCRAALETPAPIKNPTVVFARQANIAHGPQQINNGMEPARAANAGCVDGADWTIKGTA